MPTFKSFNWCLSTKGVLNRSGVVLYAFFSIFLLCWFMPQRLRRSLFVVCLEYTPINWAELGGSKFRFYSYFSVPCARLGCPVWSWRVRDSVRRSIRNGSTRTTKVVHWCCSRLPFVQLIYYTIGSILINELFWIFSSQAWVWKSICSHLLYVHADLFFCINVRISLWQIVTCSRGLRQVYRGLLLVNWDLDKGSV